MAIDCSKTDDFRHGPEHHAKKCRNLSVYNYFNDQINTLKQDS
jgi:hypothetical protein